MTCSAPARRHKGRDTDRQIRIETHRQSDTDRQIRIDRDTQKARLGASQVSLPGIVVDTSVTHLVARLVDALVDNLAHRSIEFVARKRSWRVEE